MRIIRTADLVLPIRDLCLNACCILPQDVLSALQHAVASELPGSAAQAVLQQLLENQKLAREHMRPICQDTGMAVVFADIGEHLYLDGSLSDAVNAGVHLAYTEGYLRKSVLSALGRVNTGDNTPAILHLRFVPGDELRLTVAPKGFGSENMSRVAMLNPSDGTEGILSVIVDTVRSAGACACPPVVIGVGIGGTMEEAAILAKRQLLRPIGIAAAEPQVAELEQEALKRVNALSIGPMGLGGRTTALTVQIAETPTHIAGLPVAVNLCCHACRHAEGVF